MKTAKPFPCIHPSGTVSEPATNADGMKIRDLLKLEMWPLKDACEYVLYEGRRSKWGGDRTSKSYAEAVASVQAGTLTGTLNPALNDYLVRPKDFFAWVEFKGKTIWEPFAELADRRGPIASKPEPQDGETDATDSDPERAPHGNRFQGASVEMRIAKAGNAVLRQNREVFFKSGKPNHSRVAIAIANDWEKDGSDGQLCETTIRKHLGNLYVYDPEKKTHRYHLDADTAMLSLANRRRKEGKS